MLLGGAALTRTYVERDLREVYEGRLFYGKDAFEGLRVMDRLGEMRRSGDDDAEFGPGAHRVAGCRAARLRDGTTSTPSTLPAARPRSRPTTRCSCRRSSVRKVVKGVVARRHRRLHQRDGAVPQPVAVPPRRADETDDAEFKDRIRPMLRAQLADGKAEPTCSCPQVVYGYFPANGDGNDLVIWTDETPHDRADALRATRARTRQPYLCIADFFRPVESGEVDYAAFHIVTMGAAVSERTAELFAADKYQDYLLLHGLGVEMAEALAEYWHHRIREEWGFADEDGPSLAGLFRQQYRGGRYSWGYPACPDLEDNVKVAELLGAERSASRSARRRGASTSPSRRPPPSSATTRGPSTSSPAERGHHSGSRCTSVAVSANRSPRWATRSSTASAVKRSSSWPPPHRRPRPS